MIERKTKRILSGNDLLNWSLQFEMKGQQTFDKKSDQLDSNIEPVYMECDRKSPKC